MILPVLDADLESFLINNILMVFFCYVLRCKYLIIAITRDKQTAKFIFNESRQNFRTDKMCIE